MNTSDFVKPPRRRASSCTVRAEVRFDPDHVPLHQCPAILCWRNDGNYQQNCQYRRGHKGQWHRTSDGTRFRKPNKAIADLTH